MQLQDTAWEVKMRASEHAQLCQDIQLAVSDSTKLLLLRSNLGGFHAKDAMVSADANGQRRNADDKL